MGKIKNLLLNKINIMLGAVLSMLGWSGCDEVFNSEDLYGCPYSYYQLEGAVLDDEEKPVGNIRVATKWIFSADDNFSKTDTTFTDADGRYIFFTQDGYSDSVHIVVDDPQHGTFAPDSADIRLIHTGLHSDESWCSGTYVGKADFKLKKLD
ncbi:MAG: radical SAM-associated putative lipoprotein [Bacteroidales bacterium]|nr:radical SAM-associated putative lipoprotein [Bacteroidales bacterium]